MGVHGLLKKRVRVGVLVSAGSVIVLGALSLLVSELQQIATNGRTYLE